MAVEIKSYISPYLATLILPPFLNKGFIIANCMQSEKIPDEMDLLHMQVNKVQPVTSSQNNTQKNEIRR
jgi:hypothetical protein